MQDILQKKKIKNSILEFVARRLCKCDAIK